MNRNNIESSNKEKKTVWNEPNLNMNIDNSSSTSENFQIMNMQYKIKKIKNKRKIDRIENYKNIPRFETLSNDPVETFDNISDSNQYPEKHNATSSNKPVSERLVENINQTLNPLYKLYNQALNIFTKNVAEPFGAGKDDYECGGFPGSCSENVTRAGNLSDIIEIIYQYIIAFNKWVAYRIINTITDSETDKNDVDLVAHYIAILEGVAFSSIVVYNWYYLIYYMKIDKKLPFSFSRETIKGLIEKGGIYRVLSIFLFFFEYAIFFPEMIDTLLLHGFNFYPKITPDFINSSMRFFLLYFVILYICIYLSFETKNVLIEMLNWDKTNNDKTGSNSTNIKQFVTWSMGGIIALLFALDCIFYGKNKEEEAFKEFKKTGIGAYISLFKTSTFLIAGIAVYFLIRGIIIMVISVPSAIFMCGLYFLFYSLFGIFIYRGGDTLEIFRKIDEHILASSKTSTNQGSQCEDESWIKKIFNMSMAFINSIMDIAFLKLFVFTFISVLVMSAIDYSINITKFVFLAETAPAFTLNIALALLAICIAIIVIFFEIMNPWSEIISLVKDRLRMFNTNAPSVIHKYEYNNNEYAEKLAEDINKSNLIEIEKNLEKMKDTGSYNPIIPPPAYEAVVNK